MLFLQVELRSERASGDAPSPVEIQLSCTPSECMEGCTLELAYRTLGEADIRRTRSQCYEDIEKNLIE